MTTDTPICRLVRCPKCRLVLPELADLPVYKCGGCGTVLQAKRRKDAAKSTNSNFRETNAVQMNSLDQDAEDKESHSSSHKASCGSSGDSDNGQLGNVNLLNEDQNDDFLEQNDLKGCSLSGEQLGGVNVSNEDQNNDFLEQNDPKDSSLSGDSDSEQLGGVNLSTEDQNDDFLEQNDQKDCSLSGDSDSEQLGEVNLSTEDQNDDFLEQNDRKDCSLSGDSDSEQLGGVNLSTEDQNDDFLEQNYQKDCGLSGDSDSEQFGGVNLSTEDQNDGSLEQNDQKDFGVSGACNNEQLRGGDLSNEDHIYETHHNESYERNIQHNGVPEVVCSPVDLPPRQNEELSPLEESNKEVDVNDENSPISRGKSDVESNDENNSTIKRSSTEKPVAINGMRQVVTAEGTGTARESISSDMLRSSPPEQMEHSQEGIAYVFDRVRSTDTLETTDFINPSSELSGKLIDLSKSPTTRSYHAYYDGCTSSLDGMDDQSPDHYRNSLERHRHPLKNSYKAPNRDVPEERPRRNKFLANGDAEMQHQARKFSSSLSGKMHKWNQDELQKPIGLGYPGGNRRSERDEYSSWLPSYQRGLPIGFESGSSSNQLHGSSSNQLHDEFHRHPSIHLHNKHEYTEQEKRKLLIMVNELQDQLNRTYNLNEETEGRDFAGIARENHMPMYYDHKAPEEQSFYNSNYPMFPGRFRQKSNWSQQSQVLHHKPFSGEATYGRHRMDSCLCCRPSDWHNSTQLPPFGPFHNKGGCRIHPSQSFHPSYGSCPSSPQQHLGLEFPLRSRETKSDDQRNKDHGVKRYLREKQYSGKKHLRPIAGAAPFITCRRCLKQLQLPADFLVFGRRCHRLKCGACSEVIKFSIRNGTHLVPYSPPNLKNPPPSEVGEYSDATDRRNLASASHPNESPKVGEVSYSDDYSFSKSCSSDVDPASFTPMHPVPGNAGDRKIPIDSLKSKQESNMSFSKESRNKGKNPVEGYMSAEPSASTSKARRISSEIEELPPRSSSPLHRLMGYSSPSEVIRGSGPASSRRS
ncbi:hypothetical protein HS088_TW13G01301 [Tripterygium wilfordii]|uniref:Zinc-ribbon domain-containing protein n=1 Tax=Tripterygium wilfordii TaxID=458696 RepID=A0A7J7CW90_TRIWF|nr:uncharacterized protein LOC120012723 [Tripterygium wilfordii]KAF5738402.1 hypothetical protein HS088_TW13G01301 [Tripterygium wilfordii]